VVSLAVAVREFSANDQFSVRLRRFVLNSRYRETLPQRNEVPLK
jgi:hypothetical protein